MTTSSPHFPKQTALRVGYEQCLDDYAIAPVIKAVTACATQPISEQESSLIAALLIEQLPHLINPELIGSYLSAIRGEQEVLSCPILLKYPQSIELPFYLLPTYIFGCLRDAGKYTKKGKSSLMSAIASSLQVGEAGGLGLTG